jgi:hypothetical protein
VRPRYLTQHRKDDAEPGIVSDLEDKAGYRTWDALPDDRLVWHPKFGRNWFRLLSIKTPDEKGRIRKRRDQKKQDEFCELTGVPRVATTEQALVALEAE